MYNSKKILMVINVDWLFLMHRICIGKEALQQNYEVFVATKNTGRSKEIEKAGLNFVSLTMARSSVNIFSEFKLILEMVRLYKKVNPDIVYHVTMKPVIYGSIISRILNIKVLNTISGLGYNFTEGRRSITQRVMAKLMQIGFNTQN